MSKENTINKIRERCYWEINIHPYSYDSKLIKSRAELKEIVRNSIVELRGWNYPHFRDKEGEPYPVLNGIEKYIDWENHIELWRMTLSGNFYHLLGLREDWTENLEYRNLWSRGDELKDKKILGVLGALYTIVEIFEFAKRLTLKGLFQNFIIVSIKLYDLIDRELYIDSYDRVPFMSARKAHIEEPWSWERKIKVKDIVEGEISKEESLKAFLDLVDIFGWENPPIEVFKNDINKFLEGKI